MKSEPVLHPHPLDYRATIVVCVAAAGLSFKYFQGFDLSMLMLRYEAWPQEPWRLLTSCLLHASWLHLIFNLYWTWRFGQILEPIFGLLAMIGIYVLLGAGSAAAEWAVNRGGIGLSGIGYGLFGLCWALHRYHPSYRGVMDDQTLRLFVGWFFFCIAATMLDWMPIANVAHGMGAVLGGLLGMSLSPFLKWRKLGRGALATVVPLIVVLSTVGRPYVNLSKGRAWELFQDASEAFAVQNFAEAARLLELSVARDPSIPEAWNNLAFAYQELGLKEEADRAWARKLEVDREQEEAQRAAGEDPRRRSLKEGMEDLFEEEP